MIKNIFQPKPVTSHIPCSKPHVHFQQLHATPATAV
jgi:hypothetical protein